MKVIFKTVDISWEDFGDLIPEFVDAKENQLPGLLGGGGILPDGTTVTIQAYTPDGDISTFLPAVAALQEQLAGTGLDVGIITTDVNLGGETF